MGLGCTGGTFCQDVLPRLESEGGGVVDPRPLAPRFAAWSLDAAEVLGWGREEFLVTNPPGASAMEAGEVCRTANEPRESCSKQQPRVLIEQVPAILVFGGPVMRARPSGGRARGAPRVLYAPQYLRTAR